MKNDLSNPDHWRSRKAISDAAINMAMTGNCMLSAFHRSDWKEIARLYKEAVPQMERLAAIFDRTESKELSVRDRVMQFPLSTESITIARSLKAERYYSPTTGVADIARRVEKIRSSTRQA